MKISRNGLKSIPEKQMPELARPSQTFPPKPAMSGEAAPEALNRGLPAKQVATSARKA